MPEKKMKLLVADDHKLFIEGLKYVLKNEMQIEIAGIALNGKQAIEKCGEDDYDAVIMDINMPVIGGIEATAEIKKLYPYLKVIIVSSSGNLQSITQALKAGADAYLLKDEGSEELVHALRTTARNEVYISSSLEHLVSAQKGDEKSNKDYAHFAENLITPREKAILKLIAEGYTGQQIADTLYISVKTADTHRKNLLAKLKVPNTASLVKFAMENNLI